MPTLLRTGRAQDHVANAQSHVAQRVAQRVLVFLVAGGAGVDIPTRFETVPTPKQGTWGELY